MKNGWREIIGRTVAGVIVAKSRKTPHHQVFLVFADGTSFEIYGDAVTCSSGVLGWANPERAIDPRHGQVVSVYGPRDGPLPGTPLQCDGEGSLPRYYVSGRETPRERLNAWDEAITAIRNAQWH